MIAIPVLLAAAGLCALVVRQLRTPDDPWLTVVEDEPHAEVPDWYGGSQVHTCAPPDWYVPCLDRPTTVRSFRIRPVSYVGSAA